MSGFSAGCAPGMMVSLNVHFHLKKSLPISKGMAAINKTGDVQEILNEVEAKPEAPGVPVSLLLLLFHWP